MSGDKACRILVVEDQGAISLLIEDMLLDLGLDVVGPAATLERACALILEAELDAAVLDINVGGAMSYPVADLLRDQGIPIVFATGYSASALPERFRSTPTLHKPFNRQSFGQALEQALAGAPCEIDAAHA